MVYFVQLGILHWESPCDAYPMHCTPESFIWIKFRDKTQFEQQQALHFSDLLTRLHALIGFKIYSAEKQIVVWNDLPHDPGPRNIIDEFNLIDATEDPVAEERKVAREEEASVVYANLSFYPATPQGVVRSLLPTATNLWIKAKNRARLHLFMAHQFKNWLPRIQSMCKDPLTHPQEQIQVATIQDRVPANGIVIDAISKPFPIDDVPVKPHPIYVELKISAIGALTDKPLFLSQSVWVKFRDDAQFQHFKSQAFTPLRKAIESTTKTKITRPAEQITVGIKQTRTPYLVVVIDASTKPTEEKAAPEINSVDAVPLYVELEVDPLSSLPYTPPHYYVWIKFANQSQVAQYEKINYEPILSKIETRLGVEINQPRKQLRVVSTRVAPPVFTFPIVAPHA